MEISRFTVSLQLNVTLSSFSIPFVSFRQFFFIRVHCSVILIQFFMKICKRKHHGGFLCVLINDEFMSMFFVWVNETKNPFQSFKSIKKVLHKIATFQKETVLNSWIVIKTFNVHNIRFPHYLNYDVKITVVN